VAADSDENASGLYLADAAEQVPNVHHPGYIDSIESVCRNHGVDIVFVASGAEIPVLSKVRDNLEKRTAATIIVNSPRMLAVTDDKWATYEAIAKARLRVPESTIDNRPEALKNFSRSVDFPIIVKPRVGKGSQSIHRCETFSQMVAAFQSDEPMIGQRLIGNKDQEYTVGVLGTEDGQILGSITLRRYLKNGITSAAEVVDDPATRSYCEDICRLLCPHGYCNVQLRLENARPYAFEINGRVSSSTHFRALAGFNEPEILIRHYVLNEKISPYVPRPIRMVRAHEEMVAGDLRWDHLHTQ
jgi:carbamoyl-phosphate synthase large subunit